MNKLLMFTLLIGISGCASTPTVSPEEAARAHCRDLATQDKSAGRSCRIALGVSQGVPVKCVYLVVDGHEDEGERCMYEAHEAAVNAQKTAQAQQTQYRLEHPVDISPELQFIANKWSRQPAAQPKATQCTTLTHLNGYGQPVQTTSCD